MSLATPASVQKLQTALHDKAKRSPDPPQLLHRDYLFSARTTLMQVTFRTGFLRSGNCLVLVEKCIDGQRETTGELASGRAFEMRGTDRNLSLQVFLTRLESLGRRFESTEP